MHVVSWNLLEWAAMNDPLAFTAAILAWKITGIDGLDDTLSFFIVIIGAGYLIVAVAAVIIEWGLEKGIGLISKSIRNAGYKKHGGPTPEEVELEESVSEASPSLLMRLAGLAFGLGFVVLGFACETKPPESGLYEKVLHERRGPRYTPPTGDQTPRSNHSGNLSGMENPARLVELNARFQLAERERLASRCCGALPQS